MTKIIGTATDEEIDKLSKKIKIPRWEVAHAMGKQPKICTASTIEEAWKLFSVADDDSEEQYVTYERFKVLFFEKIQKFKSIEEIKNLSSKYLIDQDTKAVAIRKMMEIFQEEK